MLNLLPKEQKKAVTREYRMRFWTIALMLALAAEVISMILLLPSYFTAETRINLLNMKSVDLEVKNATAETAQLSELVRSTNGYLSLLTASTTPTGIVNLFQKITNIRGGEIKITGLAFTSTDGKQQVMVSGNAQTRQSLLDFTKRLKAQDGIISVDLPVSDFAKSEDIDFMVTILAKQNS